MSSSETYERAVLGGAMLEAQVCREALDSLTPEMFYWEKHRLVFRTFKDLAANHSPVDPITVYNKIKEDGKEDEITSPHENGFQFLNSVARDQLGRSGHGHYIMSVYKAHLYRKIKNLSMRLSTDPDNAELVEEIQQTSFLRSTATDMKYFSIKRDLHAALDELQKPADEKDIIDTGFKSLDAHLYGIARGDLVTVAARPGGGKTALMTRLALNWAKIGHRVFMFTTEMMEHQMVNRMLPALAGVKAWHFRRKNFDAQAMSRVIDACGELYDKADIYLLGRRRPTINDIRSAVMKVKPDIVIVDYLQRCIFPPGDNMAYRVEGFMEGLKDLSLEHGIRVILGAQLKRETDYNSKKKRPVMADLRDSSSIEHQSDAVLLLHDTTRDESLSFRKVEGIWAKNRNGLLGVSELIFEKDFVNFCEGMSDMIEPEPGAVSDTLDN